MINICAFTYVRKSFDKRIGGVGVVVAAIIIIIIIIIIMIMITIIIIITNNKPDIIIRDNGKRTCILIDVGIPGDRNVIKEEADKILKYKDLTLEIQRMWNVKTRVIPVIIGAIYIYI